MPELDLQAVNSLLDTVVVAELPDGRFELVGEAVDWFHGFASRLDADGGFHLEEMLVFFDTYLDEVREVLAREPATQVSSGPWSETDSAGSEQNFSATALLVDGRIVIQLKRIGQKGLYHQAVFQKAREYSLNYERLVKDRDRREVLLHTIVHDLAGPLTAINGALELVSDGDGDLEVLINMALDQCEKERRLLRTILDTFAAEFAPFDPESVTPATAPDLLQAINEVITVFKPAFSLQDINLIVEHDLDAVTPHLVMAEEEGLRRVLSNLLENALRYSPQDSETVVRLSHAEDWYTVAVEDFGPGIPAATRAVLFDRFAGGGNGGGKIGLGLYFCRTAIMRWGGTINCIERPNGPGTIMQFSLRSLESA